MDPRLHHFQPLDRLPREVTVTRGIRSREWKTLKMDRVTIPPVKLDGTEQVSFRER